MKPIIKVEHLSKEYQIGGNQKPYSTFRESIVETVKSPFKSLSKTKKDSFWALRDINFEIYPGDVVGIIGKNGAGKSTLLKILSRITEPTSGKIDLYGRVGSLLEVGTGFHPELTGRENIFLNGSILGMRREEIAKKFDEIVDFSEIEKFLDTPVKFYSSGMYTRLAFAVAANLEPEVLIVDEVLAVGDAEFQKKCLGKMKDVSEHGRTVLFVSHQMGTIAQLCQKAILLEKGVSIMQDRTDLVIDYYINNEKFKTSTYAADSSVQHLDMYIKSITVLNEEENEQSSFRHNEPITVRVKCIINKMIRSTELRMAIRDGRSIVGFTSDIELGLINEDVKEFEADFVIPPNILRPNNYSLIFSLFIPHQQIIEILEDVVFFSIFDSGTKYSQSEGTDYGIFFSPCQTSLRQIS